MDLVRDLLLAVDVDDTAVWHVPVLDSTVLGRLAERGGILRRNQVWRHPGRAREGRAYAIPLEHHRLLRIFLRVVPFHGRLAAGATAAARQGHGQCQKPSHATFAFGRGPAFRV